MGPAHTSAAGVNRGRLLVVFGLTLTVFVVELAGGLVANSLAQAVDVLLEATPKGVDLDNVRSHIQDAPGVEDVHDLHAWTITSGMNVVSAHVVLKDGSDPPTVLDHLCRCLSGDFDIEHSTFQLESADRGRLEEANHV